MSYPNITLLSPHWLHTPAAQGRVGFVGAYVGEGLTAAGALVVRGFFDDGGEISASGDLEIAEDEEFVEGGGIVEDGVLKAFGGQGQGDGGLQVGADLFVLTGFFDGLLDGAANL